MLTAPFPLPNQSLSREAWRIWLDERLCARERTFCNEPSVLIADYNREIEYKTSYHGRELLEMLQNADDAGEGYSQPRVVIVVSMDGLCVANEGKTFSPRGVESLMISHNSPKQLNRSQYIGYRGLGFRSILNWTSCPFILSGALALGFDRTRAENWLKELCVKDENVRRIVDERQLTGIRWPVPLLSVPALLDESDSTLPHTKFSSVWTEAQRLRNDGYNTVVAIPFAKTDTYNAVMNQLRELSPEILLFTRNLHCLRLETPEHSVTWKAIKNGQVTTLIQEGTTTAPQKWHLFEEVDEIPNEHLTVEQKARPGYEIRIAIPENRHSLSSTQIINSHLYHYFPTLVRFPLPLIAHATLELTSDRQNLVEHPANTYIAHRLANVIADAAETYGVADDPWRPLSLVTPHTKFDPRLEKMDFPEILRAAARERRIVPTRSNDWQTADGALLLPAPTSGKERPRDAEDWLPLDEFDDLVQDTNETLLNTALDALSIRKLDVEELRERLDRVASCLTIDKRALLIAGLVKSDLLPTDPTPNLLINTENKPIPPGETLFLTPSGTGNLPLPDWMPLHLLHPDLAEALQIAFGGINARTLTVKMTTFGLREYSFLSLANAINARANEQSRKDPVREREYRLSIFQWMYRLYVANNGSTGSLGPRSEELRIILPTRAGTFAQADTLYFGNEYIGGELTEALYSRVAPGQFVVSPANLNMGEESEHISDFLGWLGVTYVPRLSKVKDAPNYLKSVRMQFHYPVRFQDNYTVSNADQWPHNRSEIMGLSNVEHLEKVLKFADPHAIIAWVARDGRFPVWQQGEITARLLYTPLRAQNPRVMLEQTLPSYILWQLQTTAWLPGLDGERRIPGKYTLIGNTSSDLQTLLPQPAIDYYHPLFAKLGISCAEVKVALERVGCVPNLDSLSWENIYSLLLEMPTQNPEGRESQSLYRALMEKADEPEDGPMRADFLEEGTLWGQHGDQKGYFPHQEMYYVDTTALPNVIGKAVPLLALERRRGAQKVQFRLGVQVPTQFEIEVEESEPHPLAEVLSQELDRLKPYVYALRLGTETTDTSRAPIRGAKVQLCRFAKATAYLIQKQISIELQNPGESLIARNVAYVVADVGIKGRLLEDPDLAFTVGSLLADLLDVRQESDFTLLATASNQKHRLSILARLLDSSVEDAQEKLRRAHERLEIQETEEVYPRPTPYIPPPDQTVIDLQNSAEPELVQETETPPIPLKLPDEVRAEPSIPPSPKISRKISVRVQNTPEVIHRNGQSASHITPRLYQDVAFKFEEAEGQERFPLDVAHLQGQAAYGCDILSFRSEEDRLAFETETEHPDMTLVERFIEVKGSSSQGEVTLTTNEKEAANCYKDRYYIYRVAPGKETGSFALAILNDPLDSSYKLVYQFAPEQSSRSVYWTVIGVQSTDEPHL